MIALCSMANVCADMSVWQMIEDNTPTVTARRRKPTRHMRLRLETAKKLRDLGSKRKESKKVKAGTATAAADSTASKPADSDAKDLSITTAVKTRAPKIKEAGLAHPPVPKAKFRKRQIHKSWLPTHLFHAKRAHMTPPSAPLWRFSVPLTPTAKCYRPIHRASHERGAVAWDTSYMSTMGVEGPERSVIGTLRAMGLDEAELSGRKGLKWRTGVRVLESMVVERENPTQLIAPVTFIWCVPTPMSDGRMSVETEKRKRKLLLRVHPSAFFPLWEEVLRLSKVAKPEIMVEDLRFEVGSIETTGPGATEALLGTLWPSAKPSLSQSNDSTDSVDPDIKLKDSTAKSSVETIWTSLAGLTSTSQLPANALLGFDIQDPRLHHPPRTIKLPKSDEEQRSLLRSLAQWSIDTVQQPTALFNRGARLAAIKSLPSQQAINRRKGLARPGQYPEPSDKDPKIPTILYAVSRPNQQTRKRDSSCGSWTLLLPWKAVQPTWYSLLYYPLSTGQQPRFGGLNEVRQLAFEAGRPWFPADYPGTYAGWQWEVQERDKRHAEWKRKPKGKRVRWEAVDLGAGKPGEVGVGWACEWERLLPGFVRWTDHETDGVLATNQQPASDGHDDKVKEVNATEGPKEATSRSPSAKPKNLTHIDAPHALMRLTTTTPTSNSAPTVDTSSALSIVHLTLLTRGVPHTCARIYRLPSGLESRRQWLALLPSKHQRSKGPKNALPRLSTNVPSYEVHRRLAQSLLEPPRPGQDKYPPCPGEEDLVGFVTTGNFNLAEGQGTGIGSIVLEKVVESAKKGGEEARLCVVRNSGESVGRLARWNLL